MSHNNNSFEHLPTHPTTFSDSRGSLSVYYEDSRVVLKRSRSSQNVFRGLHWQTPAAPVTKFIRLISGRITVFALTVETGYLETRTVDSTSGWLLVGSDRALGYYVVEECELEYVCVGGYSPEHERTFNIESFLSEQMKIHPQMSDKDSSADEIQVSSWLSLDER